MAVRSTNDLRATPEERRAIYERLNRQFEGRKRRFAWLWEELGIRAGMRGLDAACGSGAWLRAMASQFGPELALIGVDLAEDFLGWAEEETQALGLENISFHMADICDVEQYGKFDFVHIGDLLAGLRDQQKIVDHLGNCLVESGLLIVEDIDIDLWSICPADERFTRLIEAIQTRGNRHKGREIAGLLDRLGYRDVQVEGIGRGFRLDKGGFSTLHTFLPPAEQAEAEQLIQSLAATAVEDHRFGYVERIIISARKQ